MSPRAAITLVAIGVVAAVLGVSHWAAYQHGISVENADRRAEVAEVVREHGQHLADINSKHQQALAAELQRRLDQQAQHEADMAALDSKFTKEMQDARRQAAADVAAVRSGAVRVRDRFACPASGSAAGASGAGTAAGRTASVGDAGTPGGLQTADAEFLLSEAGRADEVTLQLQACQAIVLRDRGQQ